MLKCYNCQQYSHPPKNLKNNRPIKFCIKCHKHIKNPLKRLNDMSNQRDMLINLGIPVNNIKKNLVNKIQNTEVLLSRNPYSSDTWFHQNIPLTSSIRISKNKPEWVQKHFSRMIVGKFLFKLIVYLHRWKWRAMTKHYLPETGLGYINSLESAIQSLESAIQSLMISSNLSLIE